MTIERYTSLQKYWPVISRWEGKTGHPRRMRDSLIDIVERHGYMRLHTPESSVEPSSVPGASDFDGAGIFGRRGTRLQALWERRLSLIVGLLLALGAGVGAVFGVGSVSDFEELPPMLGTGGGVSGALVIWLLIVLSRPRFYYIGLSWRGEVYEAAGRTEASSTVRQAANVVSDVRFVARAYTGFKNPLQRSKPLRVDPHVQRADFQTAAKRVVDEVTAALPGLVPEWA